MKSSKKSDKGVHCVDRSKASTHKTLQWTRARLRALWILVPRVSAPKSVTFLVSLWPREAPSQTASVTRASQDSSRSTLIEGRHTMWLILTWPQVLISHLYWPYPMLTRQEIAHKRAVLIKRLRRAPTTGDPRRFSINWRQRDWLATERRSMFTKTWSCTCHSWIASLTWTMKGVSLLRSSLKR